MEELFGSLDYCECEHCRSVLSPAAYFVDLLHFLDPPADEWQADLTQWRAEHAAPYPFADAQAFQDFQDQWAVDHPSEPVPDTELAPYQVLTRRRPDLAQLPLTCENTNTAMPYLDVVNEILEFYVAHGRLGARRGARHRRCVGGGSAGRAAISDSRGVRHPAHGQLSDGGPVRPVAGDRAATARTLRNSTVDGAGRIPADRRALPDGCRALRAGRRGDRAAGPVRRRVRVADRSGPRAALARAVRLSGGPRGRRRRPSCPTPRTWPGASA